MENKEFEHYHCPFCEISYSLKEEAISCCLINEFKTIENQIFKRLSNNINLPTNALLLLGLDENIFKGKKQLLKVLKKMDKLEYKLWLLTAPKEQGGK